VQAAVLMVGHLLFLFGLCRLLGWSFLTSHLGVTSNSDSSGMSRFPLSARIWKAFFNDDLCVDNCICGQSVAYIMPNLCLFRKGRPKFFVKE